MIIAELTPSNVENIPGWFAAVVIVVSLATLWWRWGTDRK